MKQYKIIAFFDGKQLTPLLFTSKLKAEDAKRLYINAWAVLYPGHNVVINIKEV